MRFYTFSFAPITSGSLGGRPLVRIQSVGCERAQWKGITDQEGGEINEQWIFTLLLAEKWPLQVAL